jgi:pyrroline-5-carboxylate reductase
MPAIYTFIGAGNMGRALIGGLIAAGHPTAAIRIVEPDVAARMACRDTFALESSVNVTAAQADSDVFVLAVKPQQMQAVATTLSASADDGKLYLSIAAGITTGQLAGWLGKRRAIVRAMPNMPALIGAGVAALYANPQTSQVQREQATQLLGAVGSALWLEDEGLMDAVTALSGSGPAYFFQFIEHLEAAGIELGLAPALARSLALETAYGSSRLARESALSPASLRQQVTSPGGTTERALAVFAEGDFPGLVSRALRAAHDRAVELARQMDR